MTKEQAFQEMLEQFHKLKFDDDTGEVLSKQIGKDGREYGSDVPMDPPLGYKRQPTMVEHIRAMVRNERLAQELAAQGMETFEEADDFDVGDDYDPRSPWENDFDPPIAELVAAGQAELDRKAAAPAPSPTPEAGVGALTPKPAPAPAPAPAPSPNSTST